MSDLYQFFSDSEIQQMNDDPDIEEIAKRGKQLDYELHSTAQSEK